MQALPHSIELHDSTLLGLDRSADVLAVKLRPAYVHRDGKGWSQDADILITKATVVGDPAGSSVSISNGELSVSAKRFHNLIHLPLAADGPVELKLELSSADLLQVTGGSVRVVLHDEPRFIEHVP